MTSTKKDTIYIDVDDDITGIIDRVVSSKEPIVAAVLPKRAAMLHSSVNMRLLKKAAEDAKKRLVLITTEAPVLKLAALTRVHVAKSLTSKPALPEEPEDEVAETVITEDDAVEEKIDKSKSVGELSGDKPSKAEKEEAVAASPLLLEEDTIELDNVDEETPLTTDKDAKPPKKNRKLAVPNFDKFRTRLFLIGGGVLVLIVFFFLGTFVLPRATITIATEQSDVETIFDFTANVAQTSVDQEKGLLPAALKEVKSTSTEKFTATGKKDLGTKATGSATLSISCNDVEDGPVVVPAGTTITSSGGLSFVTQSNATLSTGSFSPCRFSGNTNVVAAAGGDQYNLSPRSYSVAGFPDVTANGSAMSGGTSNVVTVVSDQDIEDAKTKILAKSTDEVKQQLAQQFTAANQFALQETFTSTPGAVASAPASGEQAGEATLSIEFTYQMLGVNKADIETLVSKNQESKIDTSKEKMYDSGLEKAKVGQAERPNANEAKMHFTGTGRVGPLLDAESIAKDVAGKSGGDTKQIIAARPGIASVDVRYDPFWVFNTPSRISRITIIFDDAED